MISDVNIRDDRDHVVRVASERTFQINAGGMVAMSNDGWWVDENDNVWAPDELPTLVLANGEPINGN